MGPESIIAKDPVLIWAVKIVVIKVSVFSANDLKYVSVTDKLKDCLCH